MGKIKSTNIRGIFERNGHKIIDKLVDGVRIYENLGAVSLKVAEQVLFKKVTALQEGRYLPEKQSRSLTVRDALNIYWKDKLQHLKSASTAKYLLSKVDAMLGGIALRNLRIAHTEQYKRDRAAEKTRWGTPIRPRTIQAELDQLDLALNWLKRNQYIIQNPIAGYDKVKQDKPQKIVLDTGKENGEQWKRLYNACNADLKPIVLTLYETGMRPGELFLMRWDWIDLINGFIYIPAYAEKTRDGRSIPISCTLFDLLRSLPQSGGLVFPYQNKGEPRKSIKKAFDNAVERAGLPENITPYALRRTRLTIWDSIDPAAAMQAGDHTQAKTHYDHYVNISEDRLKKLVQNA